MTFKKTLFATTALLCVAASGCASNSGTSGSSNPKKVVVPGSVIDLSYWNITLPTDVDNNGKPDSVKIPQISQLSHPDFFYVNNDGNVVFAAPNKAATTANSSNTRSELRHMSRGSNKKIKTKEYGNNFSIANHPHSTAFAAVGGN